MPRILYLVKHGKPNIVPDVPAHDWQLAEGALSGVSELIEGLAPRPEIVVSSEEAKAVATAAGLAQVLGVPQRRMLGLHEQLRYTAPFYAEVKDFQTDIQRFFANPAQVVFGEESANDARTRFGNAMNAGMLANPKETVAIVAHGTVISLLVARANDLDPFWLWQSLKFLDVCTLEWPALRLREPLS